MRKVIVATLALSPFMLHAQANSPAQPESPSNAPFVQSKLTPSTDPGFAAGPDRSNSVSLTDARVSTGVIRPKLIHSVNVSTDGDLISSLPNFERIAVVDMIVDEDGKPSDLKISKSLGPAMDKNVLDAVSQFRFKPATLDNQPTAIPLELEVVMHNTPQ
jgi:TonB family protein